MAEGGIIPESRNSSILATMDGESGDSSSEPHVVLIPNVEQSENGCKQVKITCEPSEVKSPLEPADFSLKPNNNSSRFVDYESAQRTLDQKGSESRERLSSGDFDRENASEKDVYRKDNSYRESRVSDYVNTKDHFRDFRNNLNAVTSESGAGLSKEQHLRASEFAAALSFNKDPHRSSDLAGMILQHHQRFVERLPCDGNRVFTFSCTYPVFFFLHICIFLSFPFV